MKTKIGNNIIFFIITFLIGFFILNKMSFNKKKVEVYPTPNNYKDILYKDINNNCFQLKPNNVKCNKNYKNIPLQY